MLVCYINNCLFFQPCYFLSLSFCNLLKHPSNLLPIEASALCQHTCFVVGILQGAFCCTFCRPFCCHSFLVQMPMNKMPTSSPFFFLRIFMHMCTKPLCLVFSIRLFCLPATSSLLLCAAEVPKFLEIFCGKLQSFGHFLPTQMCMKPPRKLLKDVVSLLKLFLVDTTAVGFDSGWLQPAGQFSPTNLLMLLIKALKTPHRILCWPKFLCFATLICCKIQASSSSSAIVWQTWGPLPVKFFWLLFMGHSLKVISLTRNSNFVWTTLVFHLLSWMFVLSLLYLWWWKSIKVECLIDYMMLSCCRVGVWDK